MTMNLDDLATFVRVAELGTFSAAAKAEGVPKSTISRRVARLEDHLDVELLRRSSRSFSLTSDGESLHARAIGALRELEDATSALSERLGKPSGRLVITAPEDLSTAPAVADLLAVYVGRYPDVDLDLRLVNRFVDLVAEGVDVGLRIHTNATVPADGALMAKKLGTIQVALYAAPKYLKQHRAIKKPADLLGHAFILHDTTARHSAPLVNDNGDEAPLLVERPRLVGSSMNIIRAMIERSVGIGPLPKYVAEAAVKQRKLVRVLPAWWFRGGGLTLLWPSSRHLAPRVRAFVDLATERLPASPWMCIQ